MLRDFKKYFVFLSLISSFCLPLQSFAKGTDGAGLVLFTAIQRSKIKSNSSASLSFGCSNFTGKHDIYQFQFYPQNPEPFGLVRLDKSGYECDRINLDTVVGRHNTECLQEQLNWANDEISNVMEAFPDGEFRVQMTLTSQVGDTHWDNNWGTYLVSFFSFVNESKASDIKCDLKVKLELQKQNEKGTYQTYDHETFSW